MASRFDVAEIFVFLHSVRLLSQLSLSLLVLLPTLRLSASEPVVFESDGLMRAETRWLVNSLENLHFSDKTLEDLDMAEVIESFMETLDYNHLYFTQNDRDGFLARFAPPMNRYLRSGNISPAFQIFAVFRDRVLEKTQWVAEYLDQDFTFDQGLVYKVDREEEDWPRDEDGITDLWKRRLQFELLNEVISRMQPTGSADAAGESARTVDDVRDLEWQVPDEQEGIDGAGVAADTGETQNGEDSEVSGPLTFDEALAEAKEVVGKRYERLETEMSRFEPQEVHEIFLTTLARAYDPHSVFLSADSLEDLSIAIENSLVGIGAVLADMDGYCTIRELIPGGPAILSGEVDVNDEILGVAQGDEPFVDVVDMKLRKVVKMIRGEKGSIVRLKVRPADAADPSVRKIVVLERDEVELTANLARARLYQVPVESRTVSIGVIELPSFYGSGEPGQPDSSEDVAELVGKLEEKGIEGLILDLRGNGGGLLGEAVELAGLFIPRGPIVQVKDVRGQLRHHDDIDAGVAWRGPLIVLVSKFTASASEIVAGALQNYDRALVVGDRSTHGKGTVQGIFRMTPPLFYALSASRGEVGATKLTVQKYYLPNGESTQLEGIKADVVIPSMNDHLSVGEADLDHSLAWDTISPVKFDVDTSDLASIDSDLKDFLLARSLSRRDSLEEFSLLEESIAFFKEKRDQELISLDLEERRRLQEQDIAVRESFDERRESLAENRYSYESIRLAHEADAGETEVGVPDEEEDDASLDIVLREGIRIMADWLSIEADGYPSPEEETVVASQKANI